jgi:ABC-type transporter Mla subunit MlaD
MPVPRNPQSDGSPLPDPSAAPSAARNDGPGPDAPAAYEHDRYLAAVAAAYKALDDRFDALYEKATSDAERERLRALLGAARDAYWRATAARLHASNPIVRELYDDLNRATQELKELLANLQRVGAIIDVATQTVRLAASLVTLAAL